MLQMRCKVCLWILEQSLHEIELSGGQVLQVLLSGALVPAEVIEVLLHLPVDVLLEPLPEVLVVLRLKQLAVHSDPPQILTFLQVILDHDDFFGLWIVFITLIRNLWLILVTNTPSRQGESFIDTSYVS
jgi:hypothetical protein